jgi:hypothetical protein
MTQSAIKIVSATQTAMKFVPGWLSIRSDDHEKMKKI